MIAPRCPITLAADAEEGREARPTKLMEVRERLATSLFDRELLEKWREGSGPRPPDPGG